MPDYRKPSTLISTKLTKYTATFVTHGNSTIETMLGVGFQSMEEEIELVIDPSPPDKPLSDCDLFLLTVDQARELKTKLSELLTEVEEKKRQH